MSKAETMLPEVVPYHLYEGSDLSVKVDGETVWLTQSQMAMLFDCNRVNITQHLLNIFNSGELERDSSCKDFLHREIEATKGGASREITRKTIFYNLDVVISVGFRVNSRRGVQFRQWANKVLRERLVARLAPSIGKRRIPTTAERNRPARRSKCAETCAKCLFGRLVYNTEGELLNECHANRPTATFGFPLTRPDDLCPYHVSVKGRRRSFAGLVPEAQQAEVPRPIIA